MTDIQYRYAIVAGRRLFYREAGPAGAPVLVLLHGYPASSFMFRNLIPTLADRWRVVAPDHLGFGHSDAPPPTEFTYSFDSLTDLTQGLLDKLGVDRYAMYVQDWGAPIGWRLALRRPETITAIITQNGNAYDEGLQPAFYPLVHEYFREYRPPLLAVWGRNDPVFAPAGAPAFAGDLPAAEIHLLDGGHFLLESALNQVVPLIRTFLAASL